MRRVKFVPPPPWSAAAFKEWLKVRDDLLERGFRVLVRSP